MKGTYHVRFHRQFFIEAIKVVVYREPKFPFNQNKDEKERTFGPRLAPHPRPLSLLSRPFGALSPADAGERIWKFLFFRGEGSFAKSVLESLESAIPLLPIREKGLGDEDRPS